MQSVKSLIIVGAGSAGWLTALVLSTYCPYLNIRLIRPRQGSPIGVGESTQADFPGLLRAAQIGMPDFFEACDASVKCGIFYEDWNAIGEHYWHPFTLMAQTGAYTAAHHYQQLILEDPARFSYDGYYAAVHTSYETCVRRRQVAPEAAMALHVDAHLITKFLERRLTRVEVLEADQVDVQSAGGRITGISLDGAAAVTADLYVDCTGFSRALFGRIATPDVMPYEACVNSVVAAQLPHADPEREFTPYTRAHAHEHGWTWSIPLRSRIGSGYVYHSDFCSKQQAEENFRAYWGEERVRDIAVRHLSFDSVSLRNPWVGNVVAIGLSAGFVEPLEASGLNWIITGADSLARALTTRYYDQDTSARYNGTMLGYINDVHDFIDVHYMLSARRDSDFWRYQTSREYPERLRQRLATFADEMPNHRNRDKSSAWAFNEVSWLDILNGYRFRYARLAVDPAHRAQAEQALRDIAANPHQGLDPRSCIPGSGEPPDSRLTSAG